MIDLDFELRVEKELNISGFDKLLPHLTFFSHFVLGRLLGSMKPKDLFYHASFALIFARITEGQNFAQRMMHGTTDSICADITDLRLFMIGWYSARGLDSILIEKKLVEGLIVSKVDFSKITVTGLPPKNSF